MQGSSNQTPSPRWRNQPVTFDRTLVLYRAAGTTITTVFFESAGRRFPVAALRSPRRIEHKSLWRPRAYELWARFEGRLVRLFRCRNAREFGKVCRALMRAREHAGLA
jgi:hypothetical protein